MMRIDRNRSIVRTIGAGLLSIALASVFGGTVQAADRCKARIAVQLDAGVENPRDPSFLSALLANPVYQLAWIEGNESRSVYELTGPASDYRCEEQINRMRRNARIQDLAVLEAGAED